MRMVQGVLKYHNYTMDRLHHILVATSAVLLLLLAYVGYLLYDLDNKYALLGEEHRNTVEESNKKIAELSSKLGITTSELENTLDERDDLKDRYTKEKERNHEFEDQITEITGTVGLLDKLSKIDEELLQKYSKVFFLNEHYMPERIKQLDQEYVYSNTEPEFLNAQVVPFFEDMMEDALDDDITLWVKSGFRSFDEQADLKGQYTVTYGSGANTFSADQGYSEHQLGTTIDFTTQGLNGGLEGFQNTPAYEWLTKNAYKYGFVLSYPEDNGYYIFEPWHWRFVGTDLADDLHDDRDYFYDLDQRDIDEYLISLFD